MVSRHALTTSKFALGSVWCQVCVRIVYVTTSQNSSAHSAPSVPHLVTTGRRTSLLKVGTPKLPTLCRYSGSQRERSSKFELFFKQYTNILRAWASTQMDLGSNPD